MSDPLKILFLYRERNGDPAFWAEPTNALTNASFLIAAGLALDLAVRRRVTTPLTLVIISLAGVIGIGSFVFHTVPTPLTKWLDIIPIALFQVLFLWLVCRDMLGLSGWAAVGIVAAVLGSSFTLMPVREPLNGSLFYIPSLVAMLVLGGMWAMRSSTEPFLLVWAACCFALAISARSSDWTVCWPIGSHFLWHLLNGVVVYLALRSWIVFVAGKHRITICSASG